MSKNSNVVCRCSTCRSCMGPPPRDRRALVDAIGDLVAEVLDARSEPEGIENIVRECPSDCSCNKKALYEEKKI